MPVLNPKTKKEFDWSKPFKPTQKALWHKKTEGGKPVTGSIRHIAHLDRLNNLARARYGREIVIIQPAYNTTVKASAGTHDYDMCVDLYIPGVSWWEMQRFFRKNGLGCWYRHPPLFGNHIHGFTLPVHVGKLLNDDFANRGYKVGKYVDGGWSTSGNEFTSAQLWDYCVNRSFGLADQHKKNSDKSWHPIDHGGVAATVFDLGAYVARRKRAQQKKVA